MKVTSRAHERYELVESAVELVKNAIDTCRVPKKYRASSLTNHLFLQILR
jgi:hypothetical protein